MGRFFTCVFPVKRFCHRVVEVQNKVHDLEAQMSNRYEIPSSEQAPCQDAKPNLNLIEPGGMFRDIDKANTMGWKTQKSGSCEHRLQNA